MVPTETPLNITTMDNIAQALAFTFDEEFSNLSDGSVSTYQDYPDYQDYQHHHHHQLSAFTSHSEVVDALVQGQGEGEGSNHSFADQEEYDYLYSAGPEPQPVWLPSSEATNTQTTGEDYQPHPGQNKKILIQRNHSRRSRGGEAKSGGKRFENAVKREEYKRAACERERARMKDCNKRFAQLRAGLPSSKSSGKRVSKIETLRMAIKYIKHLQYLLSFPPGYQLPQNVVQFDPFNEVMF